MARCLVNLANSVHLRGRETVRPVGALALKHRGIELASLRVLEDAVLHSIETIAGIENGLMDHRQLCGRDVAGRRSVRRIVQPHL